MVCMYHSFLIHWSADGHPGCFHVLDIMLGLGTVMVTVGVV